MLARVMISIIFLIFLIVAILVKAMTPTKHVNKKDFILEWSLSIFFALLLLVLGLFYGFMPG